MMTVYAKPVFLPTARPDQGMLRAVISLPTAQDWSTPLWHLRRGRFRRLRPECPNERFCGLGIKR